MEEQTLKELLNTYNQKLEATNTLQQKMVEEVSQLKMHHFLNTMKPLKRFTILIGIIWVLLIDSLLANLCLYAFDKVSIWFLVSAGLQSLLTKIALGVYAYQLVLIQQIDVSEAILKAQARLVKLQSSTLWVARILFLQLPLWTTFYWNVSMLQNGNMLLFVLQGTVTLGFTYLSGWLFLNINLQNKDKHWFQWIFGGNEWKPILQAMDLLQQIKSYETEGELQGIYTN